MGASPEFIAALNQDWKEEDKEDSTKGMQQYLASRPWERTVLCEIISLWITFSSQNLSLHVLQSVFLTQCGYIQPVTTLRRASFNTPFSGTLTKKGDYIPLRHLQIVVVYVSANMEARVNPFRKYHISEDRSEGSSPESLVLLNSWAAGVRLKLG